MTWRKSPSLGSMLYCEAGPPFGGETGFADTYATFQGLSEKDRDFLRGKTCIHDFDAFRFQQGRSGVSEETVEELRTSYPVARHPMVRTHPDTGGEMLYVNSGFGKYVEGMEAEESDALLARLYAQAENPEYQCFFRCKAVITFSIRRAARLANPSITIIGDCRRGGQLGLLGQPLHIYGTR